MKGLLKNVDSWVELVDLNRGKCYKYDKFFIKKIEYSESTFNSVISEFNITQSLRHNDGYSVMVDYCVESKFIYTAYNYFGVDLFDYELHLKDNAAKLKVLISCAKLLVELHSRGITHGDIKLENILISDGIVKLCDFEFAFVGDIFKGTEGVNCTITYAAPEIFRFAKLTSLIDVWSFGIMCYLLAYSRYPFDGKEKNDISDKVCNSELQLKGSIFDPLIVMCLQKCAAKRATMKNVLDFLVGMNC